MMRTRSGRSARARRGLTVGEEPGEGSATGATTTAATRLLNRTLSTGSQSPGEPDDATRPRAGRAHLVRGGGPLFPASSSRSCCAQAQDSVSRVVVPHFGPLRHRSATPSDRSPRCAGQRRKAYRPPPLRLPPWTVAPASSRSARVRRRVQQTRQAPGRGLGCVLSSDCTPTVVRAPLRRPPVSPTLRSRTPERGGCPSRWHSWQRARRPEREVGPPPAGAAAPEDRGQPLSRPSWAPPEQARAAGPGSGRPPRAVPAPRASPPQDR